MSYRHPSGQTNIGVILLLFALAIFIPLIAYLGLQVELSVLFLLAIIIFLISFLKTDVALVILIFSMLLSPEMKAGDVTGRAVSIRADDIFLLVIFLGWIARMAINKELGFFRITPLNRPIQAYLLVSLIATFWGAMKGYIHFRSSLFYFMKYFEYYVLFFMVTNNLKDRRQAKIFIYSIIFVSFLIGIYAWHQYLSGVVRVSAPFEGEGGEANTLGGYLVLVMMVVAGVLLNSNNAREKLFLSAILLLSFPALLFTLSRGSWLSFFVATIALFIFSKKGRKALLIAGLVGLVAAPILFPQSVQDRIASTFTGTRQFSMMTKRITLDDSASARLDNWKTGIAAWSKEPIFGFGVSSAGSVVDNQYTRVLVETGGVGFLAFGWLMWSIFSQSLQIARQYSRDNFACGLTVGFLAAFFGLLTHSLSAATFIIIRIMEPFWFIAGIVMMLPEISPEYKGFPYEE